MATTQQIISSEDFPLDEHGRQPLAVHVSGRNRFEVTVMQDVDQVEGEKDLYQLNGRVHVWGGMKDGVNGFALADDSTGDVEELIAFLEAALAAAKLGKERGLFGTPLALV